MPRTREEMKPLLQGDLDGLCGLYALINASRMAMPTLPKKKCQKVFYDSLRWLRARRGMPAMLCQGITHDILVRLYNNVFQQHWPNISKKHPFWGKARPQNRDDFFQRMKEEASRPNQGVFISIGGTHDHWSVIREISDDRIYLFDSSGLKYLPRERCGNSEEDNFCHIIKPGYVILLSCE